MQFCWKRNFSTKPTVLLEKTSKHPIQCAPESKQQKILNIRYPNLTIQ